MYQEDATICSGDIILYQKEQIKMNNLRNFFRKCRTAIHYFFVVIDARTTLSFFFLSLIFLKFLDEIVVNE